jgi:LPS export ABC transporter protein LptC
VQRLAGVVLTVVGVFVMVVAGTLVIRSRSARMEPVPAASNADLQIKEVNIREESGKVRWHLTAEEALVYEREGRTTMRKVAVEVQEPERSWTIVGEEGDLYQQRNDIEVRRNVVVTSSDGLRLETSVLRWQGADRRLWTDAPVTITREGAVIRGTALEVRMTEEVTTIEGRVRATFTGRARR